VSTSPSAAQRGPAGELARFPASRAGDAQLVEAAARGDRAAVAEVWDRYSGLVRGVLHGALGPDGVLDDLLQEVFMAFVRSAKNIADGGQLRAYLVSIAVRQAALEIRRRKVRRWVLLSPSGELPEQPAAPRDVEGRAALRALYRVLDKLSSRRRLAFVLRHVQGLEMLEVASALGVSESTARRELGSARQQILLNARREPALAEFLTRMQEFSHD
jgi:RNA polymerase sigma-70 factor, ECF subfamily